MGVKPISFYVLNEQGEVIKEGEQIQIGGDDSYLSVCRYHYKEKCGQL